MSTPPTGTQRLAVWLAFFASILSFAAVGLAYSRRGVVPITPLFGGLFMLGLGIAGYSKLRRS